MANVFDQFDAQPQAAPPGNVFDQFDGESDTDVPPTVPPQPEFTQEAREGPSLARRLGTPEAFQAAGATVGGVVALPAAAATGPFAPAVELGAMALGAAAGQAAYQSYDELLDLIEGTPDKDALLKTFLEPLKAGKDELLWSGGIMGVGPFIRGIGRRILGLGEDAGEAAARGEKAGIPVGAIDVTDSKLAKGAATVLGVFPYVGAPFRTLKATQREGAVLAKDRILNSMAPNVSLGQAGIDVEQAARKTYDSFSDIAAANYERFYQMAENASVKEIFPTTALRQTAAQMLDELSAARPTLSSGEKLERPVKDPVADYAVQLLELPEYLTARQIRQVKFDINDLFKAAGTQGFDVGRLTKLSQAQESALQSIRADRLPEGEGRAMVKALEDANVFYKDMAELFGGPTAQKFSRVDPNIFKPGASKPGGLNADELAQTVFNSKSALAIADLRRIAGDENFQQLSRKWMEDAFNKGTLSREIGGQKVAVLDPGKIADALGLGEKQTRASREALSEMLKGSNVALKDVEDFVQVLKDVGGITIPEASKFVARRAVLGGMRSAIGTFTLGTAGTASPVTTIAGALFLRNTAKVLTDPEALKAMTGIIGPKTPADEKRVLLVRLLRAVGSEEGEE